MRKLFVLLMSFMFVAAAQGSLAITNGDFEDGGGENIPDVTGWYDNSVADFWENAWQTNADWITPNGTNVVVFSSNNTVYGEPLTGSYLYQSIGALTDESSIYVAFGWGCPDDVAAGRIDGLSVAAFASDGTFIAEDAVDIYTATTGVTLLDSASYEYTALGTDGEIFTTVAKLDLSAANAGDEIFLRFNNYNPVETGSNSWPVLDNVRLVPEPTSLILLGLGGLALRRKS